MPLYEFYCEKCEKVIEQRCSIDDIGNQKCMTCGNVLKRYYGSAPSILGFPKGWSTFNNPDITKPQTPLQIKRHNEFMENSQPD